MRPHHFLPLLLCTCTTACVTFQRGPSEALPASERLLLGERGQLRVIDRGAGEPLLLVHGYGASTASYAPLLAELSTTFRVLAVDLPGFGRSDRRAGDYSTAALADLLARILDEKQIPAAHVVGHSFGGAVVMAFAQRHPQRLRRLVVISGFLYDDQKLPLMRWSRLPGLGELLYGLFYRQGIGERMYLNFHDPRFVTEEVVSEVRRSMDREGALAAALATARGMRFAEAEGGYPKVGAETLVLWGAEDRVARLPFAVRLARELPRGRLQLLPACGHLPMWECRGATLDALRHFLVGEPMLAAPPGEAR